MHLLQVLEVSPALSSRMIWRRQPCDAIRRATGAPARYSMLGVQHHHAHIASILAEHHVAEPVLAIALDGVGMGTDGTIWGGGLLRVDGACFERLGHLRPYSIGAGAYTSTAPWCLAAAMFAGDGTRRRMGAPLCRSGAGCAVCARPCFRRELPKYDEHGAPV